MCYTLLQARHPALTQPQTHIQPYSSSFNKLCPTTTTTTSSHAFHNRLTLLHLPPSCPIHPSTKSAQTAPTTLPKNNPSPASPSILANTSSPSPSRSLPSSSPAVSSLSSSTTPSSTKHPSNYKLSSLSSLQSSVLSPSPLSS